jgi:hypothetical protein
MISVLIGVLVIVVVGAICFWAIDKFVRDGRLASLLKLLVVLICLGATTTEAMRHAAEDTASGATPDDVEKTPVFDRVGLAPKI